MTAIYLELPLVIETIKQQRDAQRFIKRNKDMVLWDRVKTFEVKE